MRVVFDYCGTLFEGNGTPPLATAAIYQAMAEAGHELYVVTATKAPPAEWQTVRVRRLQRIRNAGLAEPRDLIVCESGGKAVPLRELKPDIVIDDSLSVARTAVGMGALTLHIVRASP